MTSSRTKGNQLERRVEYYRQREGYGTQRAQPAAFFVAPGQIRTRRVDLWSTFDVVGIPTRCPLPVPHVEYLPSCFALVYDQVTVHSGSMVNQRRKKIEAFFAEGFRRELLARCAARAFVWAWGRWKKLGWGFKRYELGTTGTEWSEVFLSSKDVPSPKKGAAQ